MSSKPAWHTKHPSSGPPNAAARFAGPKLANTPKSRITSIPLMRYGTNECDTLMTLSGRESHSLTIGTALIGPRRAGWGWWVRWSERAGGRDHRLHGAVRSRLRRGPVDAAARRRAGGRGHDPRPHPARDRAGLGGQPRLADIRADRLLDVLPGLVRLHRFDPAIPLLIAAIGIIFRGTAYALRGQFEGSQFERGEERGVRLVENLFALSSVLTPSARSCSCPRWPCCTPWCCVAAWHGGGDRAGPGGGRTRGGGRIRRRAPAVRPARRRKALAALFAVASLVAGVGLLVFADPAGRTAWARPACSAAP